MPTARSSRSLPVWPDVFKRHGLTRILNASGMQTGKGASPVCPEALAALNALAPHAVDMLELQSVASRAIARASGAEAGIIVNCSAAGIAIAVAACLAGDDLAKIEALPNAGGMRREVILQRAHNISYGARIAQNIAVAGGHPVEIGAATDCGLYHLTKALGAGTAAAVYVVSHHTVQTRLIDLASFCAECHQHGVPVIVDAAGEPDPRVFFKAGADLVIMSLHKHFASVTGGLIAGRRTLVRACLLQEKGIGRPMKAGKEAVMAGIAALEAWTTCHEESNTRLRARLQRASRGLGGLSQLAASIEPDGTSRLFSRLVLRITPDSSALSARNLAESLAVESPSILVQARRAGAGQLEVDLRRISESETDQIVAAIRRNVRRLGGRPAGNGRRRPNPNAADETVRALQSFPLRAFAGPAPGRVRKPGRVRRKAAGR